MNDKELADKFRLLEAEKAEALDSKYKEYADKFRQLEVEKDKALKIVRDCHRQMDALTGVYLYGACPYNKGDVITDGYTTIVVQTIVPTVVPHKMVGSKDRDLYEFRGPKLTKKLEPYKNGDTGRVFTNRKLTRLLKAEERG